MYPIKVTAKYPNGNNHVAYFNSEDSANRWIADKKVNLLRSGIKLTGFKILKGSFKDHRRTLA